MPLFYAAVTLPNSGEMPVGAKIFKEAILRDFHSYFTEDGLTSTTPLAYR
jgi:hypothetical protein